MKSVHRKNNTVCSVTGLFSGRGGPSARLKRQSYGGAILERFYYQISRLGIRTVLPHSLHCVYYNAFASYLIT